MELKKLFIQKFGTSDFPVESFFSPGRVNLIGEHLDYNGGLVLPCALQMGITLLARKRSDQIINLTSLNLDQSLSVDLNSIPKKIEEWIKYPLGIFDQLLKKDFKLGGVDLLYSGNLPFRSGLSSSAAMEMATAIALNELYFLELSTKDLVKFSYKAERIYAGVQCGIMDQYAVGFGKKSHALLLDCEKATHEDIPFKTRDYQLVVVNTNSPRELSASNFNKRRQECEKALSLLTSKFEIKNLCQLQLKDLDEVKKTLNNETLYNRVAHVVCEHSRVLEAKENLIKGDYISFGKLMNESHSSLKNNYEVTGKYLDALAEGAQKLSYCIGSRMTGAGFGGCTINLIKKNNFDLFKKELTKSYNEKTNLLPDFYPIEISHGARKINE